MCIYNGLPKVIHIGAIPVDIVLQDEIENGDRWGDFDVVKYKIRLDRTVPSNTKAIEIVLHEVLHAVYAFSSTKAGDDEERTVTAFSTWLAMVFVNNPKLAAWLAATAA